MYNVDIGTVQCMIYQHTPNITIHYGRAEYDKHKPILTDSLKKQGEAICDLLNSKVLKLEEARLILARISS